MCFEIIIFLKYEIWWRVIVSCLWEMLDRRCWSLTWDAGRLGDTNRWGILGWQNWYCQCRSGIMSQDQSGSPSRIWQPLGVPPDAVGRRCFQMVIAIGGWVVWRRVNLKLDDGCEHLHLDFEIERLLCWRCQLRRVIAIRSLEWFWKNNYFLYIVEIWNHMTWEVDSKFLTPTETFQ
jgi:hypothetical protein